MENKVVETQYQKVQALGKIHLATERLAEDYPLHAAVLGNMRLAHDPNIPTMAVSLWRWNDTDSDSPVSLLYNSGFVLKIRLAELVGVLLHEINHVLFGHLLMDEKEYPNRGALIVAQEVTVNEFVKEPLPKGCILLKQYPFLPPMESTKRRYDRLKSKIKEIKVSIKWDVDGVWGKNLKPKDKSKLKKAIQGIIDDAVSGVDAKDIPKDLLDACQRHGNSTSGVSEVISEIPAKLDWRRVLARFVGQSLEMMPTYNRPSRRMPDLLGIIPGRQRLGNKPKVMAVIDTSGSITKQLLDTISGELTSLAKSYEVLVVECDCRIHRVYLFKSNGIKDVVGRGGTDFRPPLEVRFLAKHRPDVVMYFTDGMGPGPRVQPRVPLVWCLTANGQQPVPWGLMVRMT